MKKRNILLIVFLVAMLLALTGTVSAAIAYSQTESNSVVTVTLDGPLNPIWREILQRGIDLAESSHAQALVIELNTNGGAIDLMNELIAKILNCQVPVVVYVYPQSSMAASAGTLIVLSGDVAAMSPNAIIGAASPVDISGSDIATTEDLKIKEALKATVHSLASDRGSEAIALAEQAIDDAKAVSSEEALKAGLIDIVAKDESDLLDQLDGRIVTVSGTDIVLSTTDAAIQVTPITPVEEVIALLTNANILFVLLTLGVLAILVEFSHPGGWVGGFVGAVCLILGVYGLGLLPVNWLGLLFMAIAFVLFILDIKAPTHGALTAAGTGSFIAGGLILFNSAKVPDYAHASTLLIVAWGIMLGAAFFGIVMLAVRALKRPVVTGWESMIGREGYALTRIAPSGIASVGGEQWSARLEKHAKPIAKNERLVVTEVQGVKMVVKKKE